MEAAEQVKVPRRRTFFAKLAKKRVYYIVLLCSRLILAVCQFAVSLDTWSRFTELSRIPDEGNYDLSLTEVADFKGDLQWVPVAPRNSDSPLTYGINKLFNLYLIRLSHYFHGRISNFLLFFSSVIFGLLLLMCIFDFYILLQRRVREERMKRIAFFTRWVLYSVLFALALAQFVFLLYYRNSLCSMETLYPFLFVKTSEESVRREFLKVGTCWMSQRFLSTYVMSFLTLVPDAFLILIAIVPAFRVHSFLNAMKYFGSVFFFITAFVVLDFKYYLSAAQDPKVLDWGVERFNEEATKAGRTQDVVKLMYSQKALSMMNINEAITYRVGNSLKQGLADPSKEMDAMFKVDPKLEGRHLAVFHFNVSKQLIHQWKHSSLFYLYFGIYSSIIALVDAVAGTVLIIKRHKFLIPIVGIVNFFYFFTNILHAIMVQFPISYSRLVCNVAEFIPDTAGMAFETLAFSDLVCKIKDLYISVFALIIGLILLSFANVVNLYFLHQYC